MLEVEPYDFIGILFWILLVLLLFRINKRYKKFIRGDLIFLSITLLIICELMWLRIGYS